MSENLISNQIDGSNNSKEYLRLKALISSDSNEEKLVGLVLSANYLNSILIVNSKERVHELLLDLLLDLKPSFIIGSLQFKSIDDSNSNITSLVRTSAYSILRTIAELSHIFNPIEIETLIYSLFPLLFIKNDDYSLSLIDIYPDFFSSLDNFKSISTIDKLFKEADDKNFDLLCVFKLISTILQRYGFKFISTKAEDDILPKFEHQNAIRSLLLKGLYVGASEELRNFTMICIYYLFECTNISWTIENNSSTGNIKESFPSIFFN